MPNRIPSPSCAWTTLQKWLCLSSFCFALVSVVMATDTESGFVGCFRAQGLHAATYKGPSQDNVVLCKRWCVSLRQSLSFVIKESNTKVQCACGNTIPAISSRLSTSASCAASLLPGAAVVYYNWGGEGACEVDEVPFDAKTFEVVYGPQNAALHGNGLTISMDSAGKGTRLHMRDADTLYGMYQVEGVLSPESGVVTAFYLRSDYNQETTDFSEIDYEWLNGFPVVQDTVWLHSLTNGQSNGEHRFYPNAYQRITRSKTLTSTQWNTYTIDWQSQYISWYMNNVGLMRQEVGKTYQVKDSKGNLFDKVFTISPNKPSHVTFSIWTCDEPSCGQFGGPFNKSGNLPYRSHFRNLRRLICKG